MTAAPIIALSLFYSWSKQFYRALLTLSALFSETFINIGNSAFEIANSIMGSTNFIHMLARWVEAIREVPFQLFLTINLVAEILHLVEISIKL